MAATKITRGCVYLLIAGLLASGIPCSSAAAANSALAEESVLELCWYPRQPDHEFFITSRVRKAKKVIFFYHGHRPQRGLHQGDHWSTNYEVSKKAFERALHEPPDVPGIGKVSLHVTLRSNKHFVYTIEPWTCNLG
jgi:hypothetical protein